MEIEHKVFEAEIKESSESDLTVTHFISSEKQDRGRDILYADGMKTEGRPVVMFMHGWSPIGQEPIAKNIWLKKEDFKNRKGIMAKTQFFDDELGRRLWKKNVDGFMPNWSVGWRPIRHEYKTDKSGTEIRHVYEWELLEYSLVSVPMQPDAQTLPAGKEVDTILFKVLPEEEERRGELVAWKKDDGIWEEKPFPNFHSCRLENPDKYIRIREEKDKFGKGIYALWGIQGGGKPVELQAIRFKKELFTPTEARAWLKDHKYTCKLFEPASEKCEKCGNQMAIVWSEDVSGEKCQKTCEAKFKYVCENEDCIEIKGAIPYKKTPLSPEDEKWSAADEVKKAEVKDLKVMCLWYDSENPDLKTSYKAPHHKADGDHPCVWNGVRACAAVMMGARGGMDMPMDDKKRCMSHIEKHYGDFDKGDPPWKKEFGISFLKVTGDWRDQPGKDEALYLMAKAMIPDIAEFFEPERKADGFCSCDGEPDENGLCKTCNKPKKPKNDGEGKESIQVLTREALDLFEEKIAKQIDSINQAVNDLNSHLKSLSVKPEPEKKEEDGKQQENPPEPRKVVVVNSEEERKKEEEQRRKTLDEVGKSLSSQISETIKKIVPEVVRSEIDRVRGKIR